MTRRRRLEAAEAITGKPDMTLPPLMSDEDLLFWYGLLEEALAARAASNAPLQRVTARRDEGRSEGRRDFDNMIFRIADRLRDAPPNPIPPLVLAYAATPTNPGSRADVPITSADDDLTASDLLKVLRRKLGLER
jgi:hypothetical protein